MAMIKSNQDYVWGEAEGQDRGIVRRTADEDLITKIQVSIFVSDSLVIEESSAVYREEYKSLYTSFTNLYLKGLERIEHRKKHRWLGKGSDDWLILSYIHRDSLANSFKLRQAKLRGYVITGLSAADASRMGEALRNLYWGFLLSQTYPETLSVGSGIPSYPQVAIPNLINSILEDLQIEVEESYIDGDAVIAPLEFILRGKPVSEAYFSYYSGIGTEYAIVERGYVDLPIYDQPTSPTRKLTLAIEYKYTSEMSSDEEIAALYTIFGGKSVVNNLKSVELYFPWLVSEPEPPAPFPEPSTEALEALNERRTDLRDFLELLDQYKKLGFLNYGRRSEMGDLQNCYVAIADESKVVDILFYDGQRYVGLNSRKSYSDLSPHFKGKRAIWIREAN